MARRSFCDLNLPWLKDDSLEERLQMLANFGCDIVAINHTMDDVSIKTGKKTADKSSIIPSPNEIQVGDENLAKLIEPRQRPLKQLSRFTAVLSEPSQVIRIQKDEVIQSYDILAVQPTSEKMFQLACKEMEVDIITLDFTQRLPFYLKAPAVGVAKQRGIHFEICYSPTIRDQGARLNTISEAQALVSVCNGKNIIISSGCHKAMEIRSSFDLTHIAELFGFSEDQAKVTVSANCRDVVKHAEARKTARGALTLQPVSTLPDGDEWKVPPDADLDDLDDVIAEGILLGDDEPMQAIKRERDRDSDDSAGKKLRIGAGDTSVVWPTAKQIGQSQ